MAKKLKLKAKAKVTNTAPKQGQLATLVAKFNATPIGEKLEDKPLYGSQVRMALKKR